MIYIIFNLDESLPFSQLSNVEIRDLHQTNIDMNDNALTKLRNLTFNPFSNNRNGGYETHLTLNSDLDPDHNYYDKILTHVDACDYHDEDTFECMAQDRDIKESGFSLLHLNIRSIINKFDDFKAYLDSLEHKFSVIGLSETWLNRNNIDEFPLSCYCNIGKVRKNKQGGGVGLYVDRSYHYRERTDLDIDIEDVIESKFIELLTTPNKILIGIIYRPPNNKIDLFMKALAELLQKLDSQNKKCYLMGDFNLDLLKIEENQHTKDFINVMFSSTFYPLITKPTRITNSSATLIDNIFVNNLDEGHKCGILFTDLSDHLPVFQMTTSVNKSSPIHGNVKFRQINDKNINLLCQKLEKENWHELYNIDDPQEAYNLFFDKLNDMYQESIPLKIFKNNYLRKIPWLTKGLLISRKTKNKLYKKFQRKPTEINEKKSQKV